MKLVSLYSTVKMMHGPINIRKTYKLKQTPKFWIIGFVYTNYISCINYLIFYILSMHVGNVELRTGLELVRCILNMEI